MGRESGRNSVISPEEAARIIGVSLQVLFKWQRCHIAGCISEGVITVEEALKSRQGMEASFKGPHRMGKFLGKNSKRKKRLKRLSFDVLIHKYGKDLYECP